MTYKVVAIPTTPLQAMEDAINAMASGGYTLVTHFFGSDGTHHIPGGVGPTTVRNSVVVNPATGQPTIAQVTTNQIVMIFSHT